LKIQRLLVIQAGLLLASLVVGSGSCEGQELLARLRDSVLAGRRLPKSAGATGIARVDAALRQAGVDRVQTLPAFGNDLPHELRGLLALQLAAGIRPDSAAERLRRSGLFRYVTPNHVFRTFFTPDDSAFYAQWVPGALHLPEAWDLVRGSPDVLVAVIDTGIDPLHPDLKDAIWINPGEDLNHDGRYEPADQNGVDDDGNGLVDDIWGWDFVDAPRFPDGGDYRKPDNQPLDEHGHGTAVAGIVAATGNNGIGIAGVAFGTKVLVLRAGTSRGLLEEDDVAAAVLYAVEMGARVVNMSFGDTEEAPFLDDVLRYAHSRGLVLVAAAGNDGNTTPYFPAALGETISVGASDESDARANFSSFGETLDFLAPGVSVLTTALGGGYQRFNGTSAAAPVASGVAALLLAENPDLTPEEVRARLATTAVDVPPPGWDMYNGAGRIDAYASLTTGSEIYAQIQEPRAGSAAGGSEIVIKGTASGPDFVRYRLYFGAGEVPYDWTLLTSSEERVVDAVLFRWSLQGLTEGPYVLRLVVEDGSGNTVEDRVGFTVDQSAPLVGNVNFLRMIEGPWPGAMLSFHTTDVCRAWFRWRPQGSQADFTEIPLRYLTRDHHIFLDQGQMSRRIEYGIRVENLRGQVTEMAPEVGFRVYDFGGDRIPTDQLVEHLAPLPAGYLSLRAADVTGDGVPELICTPTLGLAWDKLQVWRWQVDGWQRVAQTENHWLPRDAADVNGDGVVEVLAGWGDVGAVLRLRPETGLLETVWSKIGDFWPARFTDLDRDGLAEIVARYQGQWSLWENLHDSGFGLLARMSNPSEGENQYAVPKCGMGDSDGDGRPELLFGDNDGDLFLYEFAGEGQLNVVWQDRLPLPETSGYVEMADLDGDGKDEIIAGGHSADFINSEHEFDTRHWLYRVYRYAGKQSYEVVAEWRFAGYLGDRRFQSGVSAADLDGDGDDEVLICVAPDLYLVDFDASRGRPVLRGQLPDVATNLAEVADFDGDGVAEIAFDQGDSLRFFQLSSLSSTLPAPVWLRATPLGERLVTLSWAPVGAAFSYRLLRRRAHGESWRLLVEVQGTTFSDTTVVPGVTYRYAVQPTTATGNRGEFAFSAPVEPHAPPRLLRAEQRSDRLVALIFDRGLGDEALNGDHYRVRGRVRAEYHVSSVLRSYRMSEVLLSLDRAPDQPDELTISVTGVPDSSGTPLDPEHSVATVRLEPVPAAPYVVRAERVTEFTLRVVFSQRMNPEDLAAVEHYHWEPVGRVVAAQPDADGRSVLLRLSQDSPLRPLGRVYRLRVEGVRSAGGVPLRKGLGDRVNLFFEATGLEDLVVYPNPWRPDLNGGKITFGGVPQGATILILDEHGRVLRRLRADEQRGGVSWDGNAEDGQPVASGVYFFLARTEKQRKIGKFAIVR